MVSLAAKTNQNWLVLPTRQSQMELGREVELKRKSLWADFFTLIFMFIPAYPSKTHTHTRITKWTQHTTQPWIMKVWPNKPQTSHQTSLNQPSPNENFSTRKRPRLLIPHEGKLFLHPLLQLIYELKWCETGCLEFGDTKMGKLASHFLSICMCICSTGFLFQKKFIQMFAQSCWSFCCTDSSFPATRAEQKGTWEYDLEAQFQ